jgi:hypothetical protein
VRSLILAIAKFLHVDAVMRQSDVTFPDILTKIGCGLLLDAQETRLIESMFRTLEWCKENLQCTVYLIHENRLVDEQNSLSILNPELVCVPEISIRVTQ